MLPAERMEFLRQTLATRLPHRLVTRDLCDFARRDKEDLKRGVITICSLGEKDYQNLMNRAAMDGRHGIFILGQIQLGEKTAPSAIENAELDLAEEIKEFARHLPPELCTLMLKGFRQSGQVEHPHGWVAFDAEILE